MEIKIMDAAAVATMVITPPAFSGLLKRKTRTTQARQGARGEARRRRRRGPGGPLGSAERGTDEGRLNVGETGLVFTSTVGTPTDVGNLTYRSFRPLLERADLPRIRFHDLRHTCATLLLSRGTQPKIVQEMLGHANIAMTMDTYSHVLPDMQEKAVNAMDDVLT